MPSVETKLVQILVQWNLVDFGEFGLVIKEIEVEQQNVLPVNIPYTVLLTKYSCRSLGI